MLTLQDQQLLTRSGLRVQGASAFIADFLFQSWRAATESTEQASASTTASVPNAKDGGGNSVAADARSPLGERSGANAHVTHAADVLSPPVQVRRSLDSSPGKSSLVENDSPPASPSALAPGTDQSSRPSAAPVDTQGDKAVTGAHTNGSNGHAGGGKESGLGAQWEEFQRSVLGAADAEERTAWRALAAAILQMHATAANSNMAQLQQLAQATDQVRFALSLAGMLRLTVCKRAPSALALHSLCGTCRLARCSQAKERHERTSMTPLHCFLS